MAHLKGYGAFGRFWGLRGTMQIVTAYLLNLSTGKYWFFIIYWYVSVKKLIINANWHILAAEFRFTHYWLLTIAYQLIFTSDINYISWCMWLSFHQCNRHTIETTRRKQRSLKYHPTHHHGHRQRWYVVAGTTRSQWAFDTVDHGILLQRLHTSQHINSLVQELSYR